MPDKDFALPAESTATNLPDEVSLSTDPTAVDLSKDPSCVFGEGDKVEISPKGFKLADGRIISQEDMAKCKWEPGFVMYFEYNAPKHKPHKKHVEPVNLPVEATNTTATLPLDTTMTTADTKANIAATVVSKQDNNILGIDPLAAAVLAVAAVGAVALTTTASSATLGKGKIGSRGKKIKMNSNVEKLQQQKQQKEKEQTKCDMKSQEVNTLIEETNKELDNLGASISQYFDMGDGAKQLNEKIADIKGEMKKLKKTLKNF